MNWWSDFADRIECQAPLGRLTWFRLGGTARYLFRPLDAADLAAFKVRAQNENVPLKLLGCGANILVRDDGFDGVVVRLDRPAFRRVDRHQSELTVGAGVELMPLARRCSALGLSGLEPMAGIPATVGGAVRMNAGGRFGDFGDVVKEVRLLTETGAVVLCKGSDLGFGYRRCNLGNAVVLSARLGLQEADPSLTKAKFNNYFEQKRRSQPLSEASAGCIFKNPEGHSAGALIDRAGLKGVRAGNAKVSEKHANFIVAERGATSSDVLRLIDLVRDRILSTFGLKLETEIEVW